MDKNGISLAEFYVEAVEVRDADGSPKYLDKEFVRITLPGGKDVIEREARDQDKVVYMLQYKAFKEGTNYEGEGFKLRDVSFLSKSEIETLKRAKIFTVEQLASVDEIGAKAIGLNAKILIQKAQNWLQAQKSTDVLISRLNTLENQIADQQELLTLVKQKDQDIAKRDLTIKELHDKIDELINQQTPEKKVKK